MVHKDCRYQEKRQSLEVINVRDEDDDDMDVNDGEDVEFIESPISTRLIRNYSKRCCLNCCNYNIHQRTRRTTTNSTILLSIIVIAIICYNDKNYRQNDIMKNDDDDYSNHHQPEQDQMAMVLDRNSYCYDSDDTNDTIQKVIGCKCVDPDVPYIRHPNETSWKNHHNTIIQDLIYHETRQKAHEEDIDFILLGDSITEMWNGTSSQGQGILPAHRSVSNKYFNKYNNANASLFGLALGSGGDVSVELLWHLQNGILSSQIKPKAFIVLIGTNDVGLKCSKQIVLRAIQNVVTMIHTNRPETPIILHALLPRSDDYKKNYKLGWWYDKIVWINHELEQFCNNNNYINSGKTSDKWCYYVNVNHIFLDPSSKIIQKDLMGDALHPTSKGLDVWGPLLVDAIKKVIQR